MQIIAPVLRIRKPASVTHNKSMLRNTFFTSLQDERQKGALKTTYACTVVPTYLTLGQWGRRVQVRRAAP